MTPSQSAPRQTWIALAMTGTLLFGCVLVWSPGASRCDFGALYAAGYMVLHGASANLYDLSAQAVIEKTIVGRPDLLPFLHPPFAGLLFAPLASLPYRTAYVVWDSVSILLWLGFVVLVRPFVPVPRHLLRYFLLCFFLGPCWIVVLQAQTSLVLLLVYGLTFVSLQKGRELRAGAFLGLGLLKFQFVVPFVLICLLRRRWRLITGFALTGIALAALSAAVVGWRGLISYAGLVLSVMHNPVFPAVRTQDWPSVAGLLGALTAGQTAARWPRIIAGAASVLLIAFAAWRWRQEDLREGGGAQGMAFAASMAVALVATPYLYFHDLSLVLLPLLIAISSSNWPKTAWRFVLIASVLVFYAPPLWLLLFASQRLYLLCPALLTFTAAVFGLLGRLREGSAITSVA